MDTKQLRLMVDGEDAYRLWRWVNVDVEFPECLRWIGPLTKEGYGKFSMGWVLGPCCAHRVVYETLIEQIPSGLVLDHTCGHRWCVNPAHLQAMTNRENILKGNGVAANNARKECCIRGHALAGENLYLAPNRRGGRPTRVCRICQRARNRAWEQVHSTS